MSDFFFGLLDDCCYLCTKNEQSMMQQTTFSRVNTSMAWLMFAIAAVVYGLT